MAFQSEYIEATIEFSQERDELAVLELAELLSSLDEMYRTFQNNDNLVSDLLPEEMDEELFYDEEARDTFIGRLYRYGVLSELSNYPVTRRPTHEGLNISNIHKESPLLIGITGSGLFIAVLWVIEGVEYERNLKKVETEDGESRRELDSEFKFNATSTRDLIAEIRRFFG
jgi:hypothetical protein